MIKTNIKMRVTPEQSKKVQEICFENGIKWISGSNEIRDNCEYLFISSDYGIAHPIDNQVYFEKELKEIDADLFIKTNGTCEEDGFDIKLNKIEKSCDNVLKILESMDNKNLKEETLKSKGYTNKPYQCRCVMTPMIDTETYISKYGGTLPKDYNSALKKIENLCIALNKKRQKNKNQKEQITILLKQKENYKQLQYDYESLRLQSNKNMKEVQNSIINIVDDFNRTIDSLEDRIKEKDAIISYLESKLK